MIRFFFPHVAGLFIYILLKVLQKQGRLKRFDKYLWSPFVLGFGFVTPLLSLVLNYSSIHIYGPKSVILSALIYSQGLWIALLCQLLAVFYKRNFFLNLSYLFAWISIISPLIMLLLLSFSID